MKLKTEKIKKIEKIPYNGYLYNLTTESGNLFTNGILVKNSGGLGTPAYERLIPGLIHKAHKGVLFCYAPETNIFLNNGKPIEIESFWNKLSNINEGIEDISNKNIFLLSQAQNGEIIPVKCLKISKIKSPPILIKVKLKSNEEIVVTPNHPLEIFRDNKLQFILAGELSPKDFLIKVVNFSKIEKNNILTPTNFRSKQKDATKISIPNILTYEFGRFLGLIASDGRVTEKGVIFYNKEENLIQTIQEMYSSMFGIRPCNWDFLNNGNINNKINVSAGHSIELLNYLNCFGINTNIKKYPPDLLFDLPKEAQAGFLQGYCEGDGTANSPSEIRYSNKNLKFINRMKSLLILAGVKSTCIKDRDCHTLSITGKNNINKLNLLKTKPSLNKITGEQGYETNKLHNLSFLIKFVRENLNIYIEEIPISKGYYLDMQENRRSISQNHLKLIIKGFKDKIKTFRKSILYVKEANNFSELKKIIKSLNLEYIEFKNQIFYKDLNYFFRKKKEFDVKLINQIKAMIIKIIGKKIKLVQGPLQTLKFFTKDVVTEKIKSIEIIENKNINHVYNLYLEKENTPVTNFIISHNCDEIANLKPESQQELLTAIQEKKYPITGQSERSSGAMVRSDPVPTDFILVAAGNVETIKHLHPALRSRIRGYGYEVYMNNEMDDTKENREKIIQFIAQEIKKDGKIPHFREDAILEIIEEAKRRTGKSGKLTLRLRDLGGLIRAAGDVAIEEKCSLVELKHLIKAKELAKTLEHQIADKYIETKKKYEIIITQGIQIGRVNGLAVMGSDSSFSGIVLPIESEITPGGKKSEIIATGKLGKIAKEAVKNVSAIILKYFGEDIKEKYDIFVQFIQTYEGLEGDSASIAVATAIISALKKVPVRQDTAMTGSLSVRGEVLAVGGVSQKIEAAIDTGLKRVIIPKANEKDVILPSQKQNKINIIPVSKIEEVLENALDWKGKEEILEKIKRFK